MHQKMTKLSILKNTKVMPGMSSDWTYKLHLLLNVQKLQKGMKKLP